MSSRVYFADIRTGRHENLVVKPERRAVHLGLVSQALGLPDTALATSNVTPHHTAIATGAFI